VIGLTSAVSLSLAVTFGFTALYAIQTLSSFVSAESCALLSTLPVDRNDFSLITLFSFVRSVDYIVVGAILSQVIMVAYYTGSPVAVLTMLVASVANALLAVAVSLWFSRIFTKNLSRGGRSKKGTVLRLFFILMWGSLLLGVSLLISLPYYIVLSLEQVLVSSDLLVSLLVSLFHPFSFGITVANLASPVAVESVALIGAASLVAYLGVALFAGRWVLKTVKQISQGTDNKAARVTAQDFSIKTRSPLFGYVVKDLKLSSRNPATAFFFALPVLETLFVSLVIANFEVLRASTLLVSSFMGGVFVLLMPLALINAEGTGLEFTKTLPLNLNRLVTSKTLISTLTYVPVPVVLLVIALIKPVTSLLVLFIPFFVTLSIAAASVFEIQLFLSSVTKGKIAALIHDLKKLVIGITTLLLPLIAYSGLYLVTLSHMYAVLVLATVSVSELAVAFSLLRRNKN
jgi:predicted permease